MNESTHSRALRRRPLTGVALLLGLACAACAPEARWARVPAPADEPEEGTRAVRTSRDPETGVVVHRWVTRRVGGRSVMDGQEEEFWSDGTPRAERFHALGRPAGRWRTWWPDGTLRSDYTYASDAREMRFFHADGTPEARGFARDGVREGPWTWWGPDGCVRQLGAYVDGQKHGLFTLRHPGGALRSRGLMRAGERVGEWRHWAPSPPTPESDWQPAGE